MFSEKSVVKLKRGVRAVNIENQFYILFIARNIKNQQYYTKLVDLAMDRGIYIDTNE